MRVARSLVLVALLPLFAACQLLDGPRQSASHVGQTRMQGQLTAADGKLLFQPCNEQRSFVVNDTGGTSILQEAATLADEQGKLFADVRGRIVASGADSQLDLTQLYRVERSGTACDDPNFKQLILRAAGHGPEWSVKVSGKGMVIDRAGQPPLALPYVEEQLGDGRFNLSTEANNQRIELWVAPRRCVDSSTGSVQHMSAELRIDGQVQRGCGYFGGSRND
ncbi:MULTISPECIES: COG3650 family protein [Pseudomonas]|jgi:putative lipoprotein|uniref:Lipoprotein n=1 Tax=Pseudomonas umsongensis TaxID=198618 RepID=A0ACC5M6K3_9PSED|nr:MULTISPECIES: membrane protein [Pseudomonas]MBB2884337.1 putative lipoprotein [Pseudomonas umsongensis]NMN77125.1 putative lipoprotein [Pseudomonas sp. KD5]